jgi:WD repeat-containing protein 42A
LSVTGTCHSTKKVAQHKGAAHKLALLSHCPHEFISGGEDGLIIDVDVRQPKPNKLLIQKEADRAVPIYRYA